MEFLDSITLHILFLIFIIVLSAKLITMLLNRSKKKRQGAIVTYAIMMGCSVLFLMFWIFRTV